MRWKQGGAACRPFEYASPNKKEQVAALLGEQGAILAGGTDLLALMKDDVVTPKRLVNIKQIDGLRGISYQPGNGLRIGALTTIAELAETKDLAALSHAGSKPRTRRPVRRFATSQPSAATCASARAAGTSATAWD